MTKLISAFIIIVVLFCGYQLFVYWEKVKNEEETKRQAERQTLDPNNLPGMPSQLNNSYDAAVRNGSVAVRNWLKTYGAQLQDPRKAWIELDFAVAITREDPAEARKIFKEVKDRTPPTSPLFPRIKQLEKSYE